MTVEKLYETYQGKTLEDAGAYKSDDFIVFARAMRSAIQNEVKKIGAKVVNFSVGHYDISGFVEKEGRYVYFSYSEPRCMPIDLTRADCMKGILVRRAKGPKDYSGEHNYFTNIMSFRSSVGSLLR